MIRLKYYIVATVLLLMLSLSVSAQQDAIGKDTPNVETVADTTAEQVVGSTIDESLLSDGEESALDSALVAQSESGAYTQLKTKFIEGGAEIGRAHV